MRQSLLFVLCFLASTVAFSQTARLQVIHNSPTPNVDVYVNGDLLLDNFVFRTATPFIDVPAEVNLEVGIAGANSTSAADAIATFNYTLADGETYIIIANGIVGGTPGFNLEVFDMGQETVGDDNVGLMFFHGSPDAPEVDITAGGSPIFDDIEYGEFATYLELPAAEYQVAVTPADDNSTIVAEYKKDFSFWKGKTAVIFASGFLSGDDPAFEPYVALSNGGTFPLDAVVPDVITPTARLQVIHNSPTPNVDVYVNGGLLLDNFVFRTATPFIDVPAGVDLEVGIAGANSTSAADAIATFNYTLADGETYIIIANGIVGGTPGFNLEVFAMGQETVADENVGLMFFHGSPDAPEVDITAGGSPIFDDIEYGEFADYLELPAAEYQVAVTPADDNSTIVAEYKKDFSFWRGKTAVIFASGFLSGDNPSFEPWVALSNGGTFPLDLVVDLMDMNEGVNLLGSNTNIESTTIKVMPNPANDFVQVRMDLDNESDVEIYLFNSLGQQVLSRDFGKMVKGETSLDLELDRLQTGIYFMQIRTNNDFTTRQIQIVR